MIVINGSFGEGGGQIVRSAISLAGVLGQSVRLENIRARRPKPGLAAQHIAAARAAAEVCGGTLDGLERGSRELTFTPGRGRAGRYAFQVGTAGSASLVLQTVLPILAAAEEESVVTLHGGTHNPFAPPAEFIAETFFPVLRGIGLLAELELVRHGFYPRGGGAIRAVIKPWKQSAPPLDWTEEVEWGRPEPVILISNLPAHVAEREKVELARRLALEPGEPRVEVLPGEVGPGNAVMIRLRSGERITWITAFGEPGKKAERVANQACRDALKFSRSRAAVDPHLADQLILPLALGGGGRFLASEITEHTRTQAEVVFRFLRRKVEITMIRADAWMVSVPGAHRLPAASPLIAEKTEGA